MANLPISGLPTASALDGTELLPFVQGGVTTQANVQDILDADLPITSSGIIVSGPIIPSVASGSSLGTVEFPFGDLYVSSGSINIASDVPGDPNTSLSNEGGNILVSAGGMRLVESGNSFIAETGSFQYISGSLIQQGDYTRFGDTVAVGDFTTTGSLKISGSVDIVGPLTASSAQIPNIVQNPNSIASGLYSTALGGNGQALGNGSTTVGFSSVAVGSDSFAQGNGTIASSSYQAALGLWNTQGNTKDLVVIGNGNPAPGGRSDLAHFTTSSFEVEGFISASTYYGDGSNLTGIVHPTVDTGSLMTTGSISANTLTFTKGDSSTFDIELPIYNDSSGSNVDSLGGVAVRTLYTRNSDVTYTSGSGVNVDFLSGSTTWGSPALPQSFFDDSLNYQAKILHFRVVGKTVFGGSNDTDAAFYLAIGNQILVGSDLGLQTMAFSSNKPFEILGELVITAGSASACYSVRWCDQTGDLRALPLGDTTVSGSFANLTPGNFKVVVSGSTDRTMTSYYSYFQVYN